MQPPASGNSWLGLSHQVLPVAAAYEWAVQPSCGAVVLFSGIVRDHAVDGDHRRDGVQSLTYEAYEEQAIRSFAAIEAELRSRWPMVGRVVLLHRVGTLQLGESAVVAVVSAPHRPEAFAAGSWLIDAVKASAPIWKHERWEGGEAWGTGATAPVPAHEVGGSC